MAQSTEQVIVELLLDTTTLESSLEQLSKSGAVDKATADAFKATTEAIRKEGIEAKKTTAAIKPLTKNIDDLAKSSKTLTASFTQGVQEGISDALEEAGVSADEFNTKLTEALEGTAAPAKSLRAQLKEMTLQLAEMKLRGEDNTEQYRELAAAAGNLKDTIGDAAQEVNNFASDTSNFDALIGAAQGIAGTFAVAQGAAALFGDESEELQETLLKVNSAMAILQGLQSIQNLLQKESAVVTKAATIAQAAYAFVVGQSVGAMKAFRIALAATGIGLLLIALAKGVELLKDFVYSSNEAAAAQERLNNVLKGTNDSLVESNKTYLDFLDQETEQQRKALELAEARGETEEKLSARRLALAQREAQVGRLSLENLGLTANQVQALDDRYAQLTRQIATYNSVTANTEGQIKARDKVVQKLQEERDSFASLLQAGKDAIEQIANAEQTADVERSKREKARRDTSLRDAIAQAERELLAIQQARIASQGKVQQKEIDAEKKLLRAQAALELSDTAKTEKEKALIREKSRADQNQKQRDFNNADRQLTIQEEIAKNEAIISLINADEEDKLNLRIANIGFAAQLEVDAAEGNVEKIKAINAKRDADIIAAKVASIEYLADLEARSIAADNGPIRRALEKRINFQTAASLKQRLSAIKQLNQLDVDAIDASIKILDREYDERLISDNEYNVRRKELLDKRVAMEQAGEQQITQTTRDANKERAELIIATAQQTLGLISQLAAISNQVEAEEIQRRKNQLDELIQAGAITEKDAIARSKRIEAEERAAKRRQAVREKSIALFDAVLNTAQGVTNAITSGDPYTAGIRAAIAAAIGAAQIAIISARPIPQFNKGKRKGEYQGYGEVGERAPEILERNGRKYLIEKPTITYLGKNDVVYNPAQTKKMLQNSPNVDMQIVNQKSFSNSPMDYDRMAQAFAQHIKSLPTTHINWDSDGFSIHVQKGINQRSYFGSRYNSRA